MIEMDGTSLTVFTAIASAIGTAIATLWRTVSKQSQEFKQRADKCEEKHEKTQDALLDVTREVGDLRGRIDLAEQVTVKIKELTKTVEGIVHHQLEEEGVISKDKD